MAIVPNLPECPPIAQLAAWVNSPARVYKMRLIEYGMGEMKSLLLTQGTEMVTSSVLMCML